MSVSLLFDGDIELNSDISEDDGYQFQVLATSRRGDPVPVEVVLASFLRDGAIVEHDRDENRELPLQVRIIAPDSQALKLGKARLARATRKRTTLVWASVDGIAEDEVFDVMTSELTQPQDEDWDLDEVRNEVTFGLRLVCLPYSRSAVLTVDDAGTPPSSGGTLISNCESTTGWAAFDQGSSSIWVTPDYSVDPTTYIEGAGSIKSLMQQWEPGRVLSNASLSPAGGYSQDEVTGLSQATGTGGYLSVNIRGEAANTTTLSQLWVSTSAGVWTEVTSWTAFERDAQGFVRYVWPVAADLTILGLRFKVRQRRSSDGVPRPYTWYDKFELLPAATTDQQIVKQLYIEGSARTTGSLHIAAATEVVALKQVLAITAAAAELPDGYRPDGRRWVTQGTTTTDSTALWGNYYTPSTSSYDAGSGKPIFDVPVGMLTTGPYTVVALVKASSSPTEFGVQAQLRVGSTNTGATSTAEVSVPDLAAGWHLVPVGTVYLPPTPVQFADSTTKVRLLFKGAPFTDIYLIPAWRVSGGPVADYSIVDCGSGTPSGSGASSSLWIDSPSVEQPRGGYWRGPTTDRVNSRSAWPDAKVLGQHSFRPGWLSTFVISTGAQGPTVRLEYHEASL